jgi:hypothetical protein
MGREHAVVQQQIDARLRRQRREAPEEVERVEQQRSRAVAPWPAQREPHATVRGDREGVLSDRRSQSVSAQALEARRTLRALGGARSVRRAMSDNLALCDP